ncbi:MAG: hypothetical protein JNM36_12975 [Chitinophagales bacterium]|nr:hypothetical protein [Chitinophagales bacterium]
MYLIETAIKKIGRVYPQIHEIDPTYDRTQKYSVDYIARYQYTFPEEDIAVPEYFPLPKGAKRTNMLSCAYILSTMCILVDSKIIDIISHHNTTPYKSYKICVVYKKEKYDYWMLHFISPQIIIDTVDFPKSKFVEFRTGIPVKIKTYQQYQEYNKHTSLSCNFLYVKLNAKENWDLICFPFLSKQLYISERLKNAFLKANISGMAIEESDNLFIEIQ